MRPSSEFLGFSAKKLVDLGVAGSTLGQEMKSQRCKDNKASPIPEEGERNAIHDDREGE